MSQELGKIEKPAVEEYKAARKLFFVPLLFTPRDIQGELFEKVFRYWDQVEAATDQPGAEAGHREEGVSRAGACGW